MTARAKPMPYKDFAERFRSGNSYFKALMEQPLRGSTEKREITDEQIRRIYQVYLRESGW